jgi:hypothetical protein
VGLVVPNEPFVRFRRDEDIAPYRDGKVGLVVPNEPSGVFSFGAMRTSRPARMER